MEMLQDAFPFRDSAIPTNVGGGDDCLTDENVEVDTCTGSIAYENYQRLVLEAQIPLYDGSDRTVLDTILEVMQVKVDNIWFDKSFNDHLRITKQLLPKENKYPGSYRDAKKILKNLGMEYHKYHACVYGCVLYYKEHEALVNCPICNESRYEQHKGKKKKPKKVVRYFPLAPRLKWLFMSPSVAKAMRWYAERSLSER